MHLVRLRRRGELPTTTLGVVVIVASLLGFALVVHVSSGLHYACHMTHCGRVRTPGDGTLVGFWVLAAMARSGSSVWLGLHLMDDRGWCVAEALARRHAAIGIAHGCGTFVALAVPLGTVPALALAVALSLWPLLLLRDAGRSDVMLPDPPRRSAAPVARLRRRRWRRRP